MRLDLLIVVLCVNRNLDIVWMIYDENGIYEGARGMEWM